MTIITREVTAVSDVIFPNLPPLVKGRKNFGSCLVVELRDQPGVKYETLKQELT